MTFNMAHEHFPKILILSEPAEADLAQCLIDRLSDRGATALAITYAEAASVENAGPDVQVVSVLPRQGSQDGDHRDRLGRMIGRLRAAAMLSRSAGGLAFVQFGGGRFGTDAAICDLESSGASAFARSVHLERPGQRVRVVDLSRDISPAESADFVAAALTGPATFAAFGRSADGARLVPRATLRPMATSSPRPIPWTSEDVVLITGGAKGITAECALALGRTKGVRLVLVGSSPSPNEGAVGELSSTFARFRTEGVSFRYETCDVTNADAVTALVRKVREELGPITGVIHAAGMNTPRRVEQVDSAAAMLEVAPKLLGAGHLLEAIADAPPRLICAFTSIIGVTGMPGNAWYGFANEAVDLQLRRFAADHPDTTALSIAFSVWGETGMGARLGSIEQLGKMGIGAIPTDEGVRRFLHLFDSDPGAGQIVVTARLGGLDTWPMPAPAIPTGLRFIDRIVKAMPGVEMVSRTRLTLERDVYVNDHLYKGSYLFPTVFGLEAMTQAAAALTGRSRPDVTRFEGVRLERPIVVDPKQGVEIEIRAEALEPTVEGEQPVRVGIRTEQTGFAVDHFSATLILGQAAAGPTVEIPRGAPLAIQPKTDLYGGLLFQGPLFQRMGPIFELDSDHTIFESEGRPEAELTGKAFTVEEGGSLLLGDPFLRDVLLQAGQLTIPRELCLPVRIDRIDRFLAADDAGPGRRFVFAPSKVRHGREYVAEIFATDEHGRVTERLTGYWLRILEERPENPSAEELAHPEERDERILRDAVDQALETFGRKGPSLVLADLPGLHDLPKSERHDRQRELVDRSVNRVTDLSFEMVRHANGRPELTGPAAARGIGISLSHDDRNALCVVGYGSQGCDLEIVRERTHHDWIALIGLGREPLLAGLEHDGDAENVAGTRVWSAVEALRKATQAERVELEVEGRDGPAVLLRATNLPGSPSVLTLPVRLTLGPPRMVALVVAGAEMPTAKVEGGIDPNSHCVRVALDGPQGQPVQELRFVVSFRDASSISRNVPAPRYLDWMGKMRELVTSHNVPRLVELIAGGEWGLVTNWADVRVFGEATANDVVRMRFWTDAPDGPEVQFYCDFGKVRPDGGIERLALGSQKATWVRLIGHGQVAPEPLPADFADFVRRMGPQPGHGDRKRPELPELLNGLDIGSVVQRRPVGPSAGMPLWSEVFQTTLEEANLVGNVYFANYFAWQNRVRDLFLHEAAPEYHRGVGEQGDLITLHTRVDYLREAMPFDRVQVDLRLRSLSSSGAVLGFDYFRVGADGTRQKLSVGTQEVAWVLRNAKGVPSTKPWPEKIRASLLYQSSGVSSFGDIGSDAALFASPAATTPI